MTNLEELLSYMEQVNNSIKELLTSAPYDLNPVLSFLKDAHGKGIRGLTILAVADSIGEIDDQIIDIATATELMHLATLIHDDIIDDAPLRRGIPSVQSKFGKKMAVIAGDYIFTQCFKIMSKYDVESLENFSKAISYVCIGEAMQLTHNYDYSISYKNYKKIITGKTAALFALSTYAPAKALKVKESTANTLARAGYYMGLVFQMIDDCLDYKGDVAKTKKELRQDLEDGVITYPLIYALEKNPNLKEVINSDQPNVIDIIVKEVNHCGGVLATKNKAKKYYTISRKKFIKALGSNATVLLEILDKIYYRDN